MINYFNFKKLGEMNLVTNDLGKYMFVTDEELSKLIRNEIDPSTEFWKRACDNLFCYEGSILAFADKLYPYYRDSKNYLFSGTSLHIFVLTNMCNLNCIYCQAHADNTERNRNMSKEVAQKAVDIALSSPEKQITIEFQGGEPLLNFEVLKYIVEYADGRSIDLNKEIEYNIVSNTTLMDEEIANYLMEHDISLSVSIDGHCSLHNQNRPFCDGKGSFSRVDERTNFIKSLGLDYGAIETTTKYSLEHPEDIINEYVDKGLSSIFIRNLTPLGNAKQKWSEIGYLPEEYVSFYQRCLDYIISLNLEGTYIKENYAATLLNKIMLGYAVNYMELRSPCGAGIGQIAYNYDGNVYTCDEGRMLAEMGDDSFKLGCVYDTYDKLINTAVCKSAALSSFLESLPNCCDCVYSPYCGKCPVVSYAIDRNIYGRDANDYKCKINRGILDILFTYLQDEEKKKIFETWL